MKTHLRRRLAAAERRHPIASEIKRQLSQLALSSHLRAFPPSRCNIPAIPKPSLSHQSTLPKLSAPLVPKTRVPSVPVPSVPACPRPVSPRSRKAQFFIASAIIMIIMLYFIYFHVLGGSDMGYQSVVLSDLSYLTNNIRSEYGSIVELTLSGVSLNSENANNALTANLSAMNNFVKNLTGIQNIVADITAGIVRANASHMNTSVNVSLKSANSQVTSRFFAVRDLSVAVTSIDNCDTSPPDAADKLDFTVRVLKEYNEPVTGLIGSDFDVVFNLVSISPTFAETGNGVYTFTSGTACAAGGTLTVSATDKRNILASTTKTTT